MYIIRIELEPEALNTRYQPLNLFPTQNQDLIFNSPATIKGWCCDHFGDDFKHADKDLDKVIEGSDVLKTPLFNFQNEVQLNCTYLFTDNMDNSPTPPQQARTITLLCIDPVDCCEPQVNPRSDGGYLNLPLNQVDEGVNFTWDLENSSKRGFRLGLVTLPCRGTIRLFRERWTVPESALKDGEFKLLNGSTDTPPQGLDSIDDSDVGCVADSPLEGDRLSAEGLITRSASRSSSDDLELLQEETIVSIISVPPNLSIQEIMLFLDPFLILPQLKAIRLIKAGLETKPVESTRVMALVLFKTFNSALTFYNHLNCQPFDVFEEATCYGIFVDAVQLNYREANALPTRFYELPTCPICLVRLDGEVTGLRGEAISDEVPLRWGLSTEASRCLVCWHAQHHPTKDEASEAKGELGLACDICQSTEDRWSCLICGHLGCGRYKKAHARKHAEAKRHMLALELGTVRVWDYMGDRYVHRLVRNQADGQIVALPEATLPAGSEGEKLKQAVDASEEIAMLKMQLESQRLLYQAQVEAGLKINHQLTSQLELTRSEAFHHRVEFDKLRAQLTSEEYKGSKLRSTIAQLEPLVQEDEAIFKHLLTNLQEVRRHKADTLATIEDLSSQLQDVNFFLSARGKIARDLPELRLGTLELVPAEVHEPKKGKRDSKKP